jgi:hypothetical protein
MAQEKVSKTKRPKLIWQQPLLLREEIQANYETRDRFMRSLPELEAAYLQCANDPAVSKLSISTPSAEEALRFYNAVVADGRYIEDLKHDPLKAAKSLKLSLSDAAADAIKQGITLKGARSRVNEYTIVTAVVIITLDRVDGDVVIDASRNVEHKL